MDSEPLDGRRSSSSRLPQYLMKAMFGCASAVTGSIRSVYHAGLCFDQLEEDFHHTRVEVLARFGANILDGFFLRPRLSIWPVGGERVIDIHYCEDTRRQRNGLAFQGARVAGAVPFFVMAVGNIERAAQIGNRREHVVGKLGMPAHDDPLFLGER